MTQTATILAVGLSLLAGPVEGQQFQKAWVSAGVGPGWVGASCEQCGDPDRLRAISGFVRVGTNIGSGTLVGLELNGWTRAPLTPSGNAAEGANERLLTGGVAALAYPLKSRNWIFLKGGLGAAQYRSRNPSGIAKSTGLVTSFGLGVDLPFASRFYLTPALQYLKVISGGTLRIDDEETGIHFRPDLVQVGVGLTYR